MKTILLLSLLLCACICTCATAEAGMTCIEGCNLAFGSFPSTDICGSDGRTYRAPLVAIVGLAPPLFTCYRKCNVDVLYPGTCSCPNACNEISSRGRCIDAGECTKGKCGNAGVCKCAAGWGGIDCSSVICPHNKCSGKGKCVSINEHTDACDCEKGYTGDDCSLEVMNVTSLPYGEILSGPKYYKDDDYEDDHPIFDIKRIANIRIKLDDDDFENIFRPVNTWNQSYAHGSFTFSNGKLQGKHHKIGIKLKGHLARIASKKSFVIQFREEKFSGLKHMVLKAPSLDPTYLHNQIVSEFYRAMKVPTVRASFATLTINGVYYGLYDMYEELDDDFINSRYGNKDGNFYAMSTFLRDLGADPEEYKSETIGNVGRTLNAYKQDFGDGTYEDLVQLAQLMDQSAPGFEEGIEEAFNVDYLLRSLVIISATDNYDSSPRDGNNWALYDLPFNKTHMKWQYIPKDHEFTFLNPIADPYLIAKNELSLAHHVLRSSNYRKKYNEYYNTFLNSILDPSLPNSIINRVDAFESVLSNIIRGDYSYHITYGVPMGESNWELSIKEFKMYLKLRYNYLKMRLQV